MTQKHKHYDAIIAFANGKKIETRLPGSEKWSAIANPTWSGALEYRVKPETVEEYTIVNSLGNHGNSFFRTKEDVRNSYQNCLDPQGFLKRTMIDGKVVSFKFIPL